MKSKIIPYALLAIAVVAIDQLVKHWLIFGIGMIDGRAYEITSFFSLVMVWNQGVSFGLFSDGSEASRWFLIIVAFVIMSALLVWFFKTSDAMLRTAISFIIGGATGNVIDRLNFGAVADFFDFHIAGYHWPAFNPADMAICLGVALLTYDSIIASRNREII